MKKSTISLLTLSALAIVPVSAATSLVSGGNIRTAGDWTNGLPSAANAGTIAVNGVVTSTVVPVVSPAAYDPGTTVTQSAGTLTGTYNWAVPGLVYNMTGGTIDNTGNFNANSGSVFNLSGGLLNFTGQLIINSSTGGIYVSGNANLSSPNSFDVRINVDSGTFNIASTWTGGFISGTDVTAADWISQLVTGVGDIGTASTNKNAFRFTSVGATEITSANFNSFFTVTPNGGGGSTLTLIPEPSSAALVALAGFALVGRRRK